MESSDDGGDNGSFEGNNSLHAAANSTVPPPQQVEGGLNTPDPVFNPTTIPVASNPLLVEQLWQFIMETFHPALRSSQAVEQDNIRNRRRTENLVSKKLANKFLLVARRTTLYSLILPARRNFPRDPLKVGTVGMGVQKPIRLVIFHSPIFI
ncbi:UNVERIFIED_CONTAM: hypothetical protein Slati_1019700 [Sesamum latifolium]|uniref:Uncharacterized protein n=1 Tax=Sesamum latifolium TaxID=2727402 RepID=A0AAW2XS35_9LAMI